MTDNEKRGKFLAELRLKKGLKQSDLAKLINYSDKSISKWERGLSFPSNRNVIYKLSKLYNVSIDEILRGEYDNSYRCELKKSNVKKHLPFLYFNIILFVFFVIIMKLYLLGLNNNLLKENSDDFMCKSKTNIVILRKNFTNHNLNKYFINSIPYFYNNKSDFFESDKKDTKNNTKSKVLKKSKSNTNKKFNLKDYGFIQDKFEYKKVMNEKVEIYYFEPNNIFKIYYKIDERNPIIILSTFDSNNNMIYVYKNYVLVSSYSLNISSLKNCDYEKCYDYKDYIMYINYLKNVKNDM